MAGTDGSITPAPVWGQTAGTPTLGLDVVPNQTFAQVPGSTLILPEAGVYQLHADVQAGAILQGSANYAIEARIMDGTTGAEVPGTPRTVWADTTLPADGVIHTVHETATCSAFYQAPAGTQVWVEGSKILNAGTSSGDILFVMNFRFLKVA